MDKRIIYINGRFLTQKSTGVHRFSYEMCKSLHKEGLNFIVLAPKNTLPDYECDFPIKIIGNFSSHLWEQLELPFYLKKNGLPLLISFMGLGCVLYNNQISTIHDISFMRNPSWFSKKYYYFYKWMTPLMVKKSKKIITVSNFSKKEIVDLLHIFPEKIEIIYNAVADYFYKDNYESVIPLNKQPYILAVSSLDPRKNFVNLIKAFSLLQDIPHKLYIIGGNSSVFSSMNLPISDNIVFLNYVSNKELVGYYKNADLFVYPSLYEGFGIPPIEAMSQHCPVLVSDIDVLHEVCGEAAFYCNPYDINDIAEKIRFILHDSKAVYKKTTIGKEHISKYSWSNSAKKLMKLINDLGEH